MLPSKTNQTISEPLTIACKIKTDHVPRFGEDVLLTFMQHHFTRFVEIKRLTDVWAYGRVFLTSSGFHGEYYTPNDKILSLLYLGQDDVQALQMIKRIIQQHIYLLSLKELY